MTSGTVRTSPSRKASPAWWAVLIFSLPIAAYGASYVVRGEAAFVPGLAASFRARPWGIMSHAAFGTLALLFFAAVTLRAPA